MTIVVIRTAADRLPRHEVGEPSCCGIQPSRDDATTQIPTLSRHAGQAAVKARMRGLYRTLMGHTRAVVRQAETAVQRTSPRKRLHDHFEEPLRPPKGIKMIGRWHDVGQRGGITISEADDAEAIARWSLQWSDLLTLETHPVLDDAGLAKVLSE
jgi:hypothetical protein